MISEPRDPSHSKDGKVLRPHSETQTPWIHPQDEQGPDLQVLKNKQSCVYRMVDGRDKQGIKEKLSVIAVKNQDI
jgi:hypothetical protein